jgi:PilZ domain.
MPEVMRHLAARLRRFVGNRRSATRYEVRLVARVSLKERKGSANGARRNALLEGHTRDVSETGLGLSMPAIRIGEHYLTGESSILLIELELADQQTVRMQAVAVRYERLEEDEGRSEYLIGTQITEISEDDRANFLAYLKTLKR